MQKYNIFFSIFSICILTSCYNININSDMDSIKKRLYNENFVLSISKNNDDFFSDSLYKCLSPKYTDKIIFKNNYHIIFNKKIIANLTQYRINDINVTSQIEDLTNKFYTTPRNHFSRLCWEESFTKPIFSTYKNLDLLIISSNENYIFNSPNDSIKTNLEKYPEDYHLDNIIKLILND